MNCVIIDDDNLSRSLIESYIEKTNTLRLGGSFSNPVEALQSISSDQSIDLLFLDIMMPEMNGIQILDKLNGRKQVIVISGKKEFALETFSYNVTDYLLKPISYERFFKAIEKAYERNRETQVAKNSEDFLVKKGMSYCKVKHTDIIAVEAAEEISYIYTADDQHKVMGCIDDIASFLPPGLFCRPHESYLVNLKKIKTYNAEFIKIEFRNSMKNIPLSLMTLPILIEKIGMAG